MPKERAPISTRLRNKDKNNKSEGFSTTSALSENLTFSPRADPNIYMDELHSDLSFVRGTDQQRKDFLRHEKKRAAHAYGSAYHPAVKLSTFYGAQVSPPVGSKRTQHQSAVETKRPRIILTHSSSVNEKKENRLTLPIDKPIAKPFMSDIEKENEFSRRQRRVFVHSRYITNEEGLALIKSIYPELDSTATSKLITSLQENFASFRIKLKNLFNQRQATLRITEEKMLEDQTSAENKVRKLVSESMLRTIWAHWVSSPAIDAAAFYANKQNSVLLRTVTVKLIIIHFKESYHFITPKKAHQSMREIDLLTRSLELPDPLY